MAAKRKVGPLARFSLALILVVAALLAWSFFMEKPDVLGVVAIAFVCTGIVGCLTSAELLRLHQRIDELEQQCSSQSSKNVSPPEATPPGGE
jgi:fatty acid desaturase